MMTKRFLTVFILLGLLTTLGACKGSDSNGNARGKATIKVGFNTSAHSSSPKFATVVVGTVADIASITVDVQSGSSVIVQGAPLTNNNGVWTATINDLPVGEPLTLTGHAYNSASAEIFTGTTSQTLTGIDDEVVIAMAPVTNGTQLQFLRITQISRPAEFLIGSNGPVSISVLGNAGETLSYEIIPAVDGGTFSPLTGSMTLNGTSATIVVNYTAPAVPGSYIHSVRVTNGQGNTTEATFDTNVASQLTGSAVQVQFNPVVTALTTLRSGSDVTFTASVSDTGPSGALTYNWSFDGGLSFADAATNPAVLQGYVETFFGTLTLTVTNGSNGSTTVTYRINERQFPVSVVSNLPLLPQTVIATGIGDCRAGAVSGNIVALSMEEEGDHDYNNNGVMNDRVLGYIDVTQNTTVNTGIAIGDSLSIDGDIMAYVLAETGTIGWYSISAQTGHDTGILPDVFGRQWWGVTRVVSNGKIAYVAGGTLNIYNTSLMENTATGVTVADPLSPSFSNDLVVFIGSDATLEYYNVATGLTTDTGVAVTPGQPGTQGAVPTIDNGIIVFETPAGQIAYYDISRGLYVLTPIVSHMESFSISNGIIAAAVAEDSYWGDMNGDGIIEGNTKVLVLYDIPTGRLVSTGVVVCCGPDISSTGLIAYDGNDGCDHFYVMIDNIVRQYFGR